MAINIGLATKQYYHVDSIGCEYPRGRVAAFSKAIHTHDITTNEMFKSCCIKEEYKPKFK